MDFDELASLVRQVMHSDSILHPNTGFRYFQMPDSRSSSASMCDDLRLKTFSRETYKHIVLVLLCLCRVNKAAPGYSKCLYEYCYLSVVITHYIVLF